MIIKQLVYTFQMNVSNLARDISNIWFSIRFAFYKWKYGGPKNIPPEVISKLLGNKNNPALEKAMVAGTEVYTALKKICEIFAINYMDTKFFEEFSLMIHGQLTKVEDSEKFDQILSSDKKRLAVFNAMVLSNDITPRQVEWVKSSGKKEEFEQWLAGSKDIYGG